jgi:hypothetical protein
MNKKRFIPRLIASPFVLGILIVSYTIGCIAQWLLYLRWGGEWVTYRKDDSNTLKDIFDKLKEQH